MAAISELVHVSDPDFKGMIVRVIDINKSDGSHVLLDIKSPTGMT